MTPRRLEALEEFLERLLQRSESSHTLDPDELASLIYEIRELVDEVVSLTVRLKDRAGLSEMDRRIWRQRSVLFRRCRDALTHLERNEIEQATDLLRAALLFDPHQPRVSLADESDQPDKESDQ